MPRQSSHFAKKILRAEHSDWDIRVAIDKVKDKLQQEIKKYKEIKIEKCREIQRER